MSKSRAFTLIELMIALSIVALLLTVGVPSFQRIIQTNRLATCTNELVASLNLARSEAIRRGTRVTIRKTGAQWEGGWEMFTDTGTAGSKDGGDQVLRVSGSLPGGFTFRGNNNFANFISFRPSGQTTSMGSFAICDSRDGNQTPEPYTARVIVVDSVGRVRLGEDHNNNHVPEKSDGTDLTSCTSP